MCLIAILFGARSFLFFSMLFQWSRGAVAFANVSLFSEILGWLFVPWTTLAYLFLFPISSGENLFLIVMGIVELLWGSLSVLTHSSTD